MITTAVLDVNETMLDLAALDPHFVRTFGDASVRREWFALVLRNALTLTIVGDYSNFGDVAAASLSMVATTHGISISDDDRNAISEQMTHLPPHDDVEKSLTKFKGAGLRLIALTNSPPDIANQQLDNSALADHFDHILSVHTSGRFKPHPDVYRDAANTIGIPLTEMVMVAAHDWDIAGAMAVGMYGAYVVRPGMAINPLFPDPTYVGQSMDDVVAAILDSASPAR